MRDALVLRGVGRRWGPVLCLRDGARTREPPPADLPGSAAAGDSTSGEPGATADAARRPALAVTEPLRLPERREDDSARTIDVVCMPLPRPHRAHRLWQLTAVEAESRLVWTELTRTRGEPPLPQLASRFVRDIRKDLEARGLRLAAIVVRSGGTQRWPQVAATEGSVPLRRLPPGMRHERLAANMHARALGSFWNDVFARDEIGSLDALRRGLDEWTKRRNEEALAAAPIRVGSG